MKWLFVEKLAMELQSGHPIGDYFWSLVSNCAVILCIKRKWAPTVSVSAEKKIFKNHVS